MNEIVFVNGMNAKPSKYGYKVGVKVSDFIEWAAEHTDEKGWVNIEILTSKSGAGYAKLDTWKPDQKSAPPKQQESENDLPF